VQPKAPPDVNLHSGGFMHFHSEKYYGPNYFATFYDALSVENSHRERAVCKLLDIKPNTLKRYLSGTANPPRAAVRLLFCESYFGRVAISTHTANGLTIQKEINDSLRSKIRRLEATIKSLEIENDELKRCSDMPQAANSSRWTA
jgi:hypothetical protein